MAHRWRGRALSEWNPQDVVGEEELLNRVILAKALIVHASGKPALFKTSKERFEITPKVANDIMKAAGFFEKKQRGERGPAR